MTGRGLFKLAANWLSYRPWSHLRQSEKTIKGRDALGCLRNLYWGWMAAKLSGRPVRVKYFSGAQDHEQGRQGGFKPLAARAHAELTGPVLGSDILSRQEIR
jgi:glucose-6-phosphate dehydrogenase assembly protein OpcA